MPPRLGSVNWHFSEVIPTIEISLSGLSTKRPRKRTDFDIEPRFLTADGRVKLVHIIGRSLLTSSGNFEFVGVVTDITECKEAEDALRHAHAELARANRVSHVDANRNPISENREMEIRNASSCIGQEP